VWCYGTEFTSKALDLWAYKNSVHLDFIRPGRPVENGYIESFNGKLRDECLNVEVFFNLADARRKLYHWRRDYNHHRPHSALDDRTPAEFAATCAAAEGCVPKLASGHIPRQISTSLLETLT
jgi:putative transposase